MRKSKYTQEFKDSAIQLTINSTDTAKKIANDLGMNNKTLSLWIREYKKVNNIQNTNYTSSSKESLEEENKRLRKELLQVKQEREILKKAAAYFAKETL
ncbi:MAG: transposase [Arcobacteraceae bacterium]